MADDNRRTSVQNVQFDNFHLLSGASQPTYHTTTTGCLKVTISDELRLEKVECWCSGDDGFGCLLPGARGEPI
jgi:hypothetical protein